jgi:Asp-tRNA(Asn)/Glu-tRNA(Gln) amidotransferase A subunit family amidase
MLGTFVLSAGYFDAYFTKAQQVRQDLCDKTKEIFKILMPSFHPLFLRLPLK